MIRGLVSAKGTFVDELRIVEKGLGGCVVI